MIMYIEMILYIRIYIYIYTKFPYTSAGSPKFLRLVSGSPKFLRLVSGQQNIVIYVVLAFPAPGDAAAGCKLQLEAPWEQQQRWNVAKWWPKAPKLDPKCIPKLTKSDLQLNFLQSWFVPTLTMKSQLFLVCRTPETDKKWLQNWCSKSAGQKGA